jgi:hypothetical protein
MLQVTPWVQVLPPDEQVHPAMVTSQLPQPALPLQVAPTHVLPWHVACVPPSQVEPVQVWSLPRQVALRGLQVAECPQVTLHVTLPLQVTVPAQVGMGPCMQVYRTRQVVSQVGFTQVEPAPPHVAPEHVALHVMPLIQQVCMRRPQVMPPEHVGPLQVR